MILLLLSTVLILGVVLAYLFLTKDWDHWDKKGIPHAKPSFPYGNVKPMFDKKFNYGGFFRSLQKQFPDEPLIGFYAFHQPMILVNDPELAKVVMIQDFHKYVTNAFRIGPGDRLMKEICFWVPGFKQWKEARSRFTPTMTAAKMKTMVPIMEDAFERYIAMHESKQMPIEDAIRFSLLDSILRIAFSVEVDLTKTVQDKISDLGVIARGEHFSINSTNFHLLLCAAFLAPWIFKLRDLRNLTEETEALFVNFINACVRERKKAEMPRNDILQAIINIEKKALDAGQPGFTEEEWASNMLTVMLDATDTTGLVLSLILLELALHPSEQEKLRDEILQGGSALKDFDYDKISSMKRLEMIMYESIRINSPVQIIGRIAVETTKLGNVVIEKGTAVFVPPPCFHWNSKYHPDPKTFKPERFEDASIFHNGTFMPFGEGPKSCLGQRYATNIMKVLLIGILLRFRIAKSSDYTTPQPNPGTPFLLSFLEPPKLDFIPL